MFRRSLLNAFSAILAAPTTVFAETKIGIRPETIPGSPKYPQLRAGTQLDHLYESMLANGFGIKKPKLSSDLPTVVIISDTQCPWCSKLWNDAMPLAEKINFIWYPIPVLNDLSVTQAALILSSEHPWEKMQEHEKHFKDAHFRGIDPTGKEIPKAYRDQVWTNAKIARWSGLSSVPLGVFKNSNGEYVPLFSGISTEEMREKVFGIAE